MKQLNVVRGIALLVVIAALGCNQEQPAVTDSTDTRLAVAVEYVRGDAVQVHAKPAADANVIMTFATGEAVSVLSRSGEWDEVRTPSGSGWVRAADLATGAQAKQQEEQDNLTPRFRKAPAPVTQPGASGEIVLEADVNSDGQIMGVRTISNTTGSEALVVKNSESLRRSEFYPIVQKGKRKPFVYTYRVHY